MKKPKCKLSGQDGNIFNLVGVAKRALEKANMNEQAKEMTDRIFKSKSYNEALCIIMKYVRGKLNGN